MLGRSVRTTSSRQRAQRAAIVVALATCAGLAGGSAAAQGKPPKAPAAPAASSAVPVAPPVASSAVPVAPPAQPPPVAPPVAPPPVQPPMQPPAGYGSPYGMPPPGYMPMSPNELPPGYMPPLGYFPEQAMPGSNDPSTLPAPSPRARFSTTMMVSGILMVGVGVATLIAGAVVVSSSRDRIDIYCDGPALCAHKDDDGLKTAGALMMAGGGALGAAGVPLWIIGSRIVVTPKVEEKRAAGATLVRVGPAGAQVSLRF